MQKIVFTGFASSEKVMGIKRLRSITKLGLKESKHIIEDLHNDGPEYSYSHEYFKSPEVDEALQKFSLMGGKYYITNPLSDTNSLPDTVKKAINIAIDTKEYEIAGALIDVLKQI